MKALLTLTMLPRLVMFLLTAAVTVYITHFVLPGNLEQLTPDIAYSPLAQIATFVVLTIGGLLVAFWITFGDLINRGER